ncbi:MAG: 2,5-diamino-6-(ribosylamino)-4(3H)-pyrimidinone 5'-phosphate reductase [Methanomicrobiales archaeon]|nr:2,5-diamino-6-(ribosylamino)-4(3H)-pyrimidinone 5'-phosphate reductase [Methanomicrobiales archaeon]
MHPFVLVNVAMSADGKISTHERRQVRISGTGDRARVDRLKAESDAIMVGIGTVLADNSSLNIKSEELRRQRRDAGKEENPIRIVVDSRGRTPRDADILHKGKGERIIAVSKMADPERVHALRNLADVMIVGETEVDLALLFELLGKRDIRRVMVEGGGQLIGALFRENLVDELYTYVGNLVIGGEKSPTLSDGTGFLREEEFTRLSLVEIAPMDGGVLIHWKVEKKDNQAC